MPQTNAKNNQGNNNEVLDMAQPMEKNLV